MLNFMPLFATAAEENGGGGTYTIIMIAVMIVVCYFVLIRPESKRKKKATEMRNALAVGDTIVTIGGIMGTVCAVKEESIVIETGADRVRIEFGKFAIANRNGQSVQ